MKTYAMCPKARRENRGLMVDCERTHHDCDGPRTVARFDCWIVDREGETVRFSSLQPHCGSCLSDQEYGYDWDLDFCCCVHGGEHEEQEKMSA